MEDRLKILRNKLKELAIIHAAVLKDFRDNNIKKKKIDFLKGVLSGFDIDEEVPSWMAKMQPETIFYAEFFGHYSKETGLTTTQIRNFFGSVRKLQMKVAQASAKKEEEQEFPEEANLLMLAPRLAYAAVRASKDGSGVNELKKVLTIAVNAVLDAPTESEKIKRFENFTNFVEAIIAYHKSAGGE